MIMTKSVKVKIRTIDGFLENMFPIISNFTNISWVFHEIICTKLDKEFCGRPHIQELV